MFSSATMESSTTIPIAMDNADIDMTFNVLPVANRYTSDAIRDIGMESMMMNVALHLPRKTYTTSITTKKVIMMVSFNELILFLMLLEESMTVSILISVGSVSSIEVSAFLTPSMTFTVLAPDCFMMTICAERLPLVTASCSFSSCPSLTVATSLRYTASPFLYARTMSSSSEGSLNSFWIRKE